MEAARSRNCGLVGVAVSSTSMGGRRAAATGPSMVITIAASGALPRVMTIDPDESSAGTQVRCSGHYVLTFD